VTAGTLPPGPLHDARRGGALHRVAVQAAAIAPLMPDLGAAIASA
jgi:hypothetical protein